MEDATGNCLQCACHNGRSDAGVRKRAGPGTRRHAAGHGRPRAARRSFRTLNPGGGRALPAAVRRRPRRFPAPDPTGYLPWRHRRCLHHALSLRSPFGTSRYLAHRLAPAAVRPSRSALARDRSRGPLAHPRWSPTGLRPRHPDPPRGRAVTSPGDRIRCQ